MITDLASCLCYIHEQNRKHNVTLGSIIVPKNVRNKIVRQMREMAPVGPGPRPPVGDPDRWLYDAARSLEKRAEVRVLGVEIVAAR